jgi:hypothetical protein
MQRLHGAEQGRAIGRGSRRAAAAPVHATSRLSLPGIPLMIAAPEGHPQQGHEAGISGPMTAGTHPTASASTPELPAAQTAPALQEET